MATVNTYGGAATTAAKLTSRIPLIIAELDDTMLEGVLEVAHRIAEGAKQRVPDAPPMNEGLVEAIHVETGADLVKSSEIGFGSDAQTYTAEELAGNAVAVVAGDSEHFYGHFLENGTSRTPPRPFLIPAFEAERDSLEEIIGQRMEDI